MGSGIAVRPHRRDHRFGAFHRPRPHSRHDGCRTVGAAAAFRRVPAGHAARPRPVRSWRLHDGRPRRDPHRPAPDPRVLEQPVARAAGRCRRHDHRISVRVHRGAIETSTMAAHGDRRGGAPAAGFAAVHDGDRDDLFVRSARTDHLRAARPEGRDRVRPGEHAIVGNPDLFSHRLSDLASTVGRDRLQS